MIKEEKMVFSSEERAVVEERQPQIYTGAGGCRVATIGWDRVDAVSQRIYVGDLNSQDGVKQKNKK